jgi:propanol-preferring alcohol dehydrogenase
LNPKLTLNKLKPEKMAEESIAQTFEIPKKHKACVYDNPGTISTKVVEVETPEPGSGEVLIRL